MPGIPARGNIAVDLGVERVPHGADIPIQIRRLDGLEKYGETELALLAWFGLTDWLEERGVNIELALQSRPPSRTDT